MAVSTITYSNKVALNENPSVADINKVKADDMNEIKTVVNNNATEISNNTTNITNITGTILWTNDSPTSSFGSQSITLSNDDYDILEFYYKTFSGTDEIVSTKTIKGHNANLQTLYLDGTKIDIAYRTATYVNNTSYSISTGHIVQAPGTANAFTTNTQCIPLYVIGYKTGLFD